MSATTSFILLLVAVLLLMSATVILLHALKLLQELYTASARVCTDEAGSSLPLELKQKKWQSFFRKDCLATASNKATMEIGQDSVNRLLFRLRVASMERGRGSIRRSRGRIENPGNRGESDISGDML